MGQPARQVLTENDDDDDVDGDLETGDTGETGQTPEPRLRPVETPPIQSGANAPREDQPEYEIVEDEGHDAAAGAEREPNLQHGQDHTALRARREEEDRLAREQGISRSTLRRKRAKDSERQTKAELARLKAKDAERDAELKQLREEVAGFKPRFTELDETRHRQQISQVDQALDTATATMNAAEDRQMAAMSENDPQAFRKAQREQQEAFLAVERLKFQKKQLSERTPPATTTAMPAAEAQRETGGGAKTEPARTETRVQPLSAQAQSYTEDFIEAHDWFNPQGGDRDSNTVLGIDQLVARMGFKPETQEYWDEIDRRVRAELPHRFEDRPAPARAASANGANGARRQVPAERRGPMTTGSGAGPASGGKVKVHINAERKAALIAGGYVNADGSVPDQAKLTRVLAKYAEADQQAGR